MSKSKAIAFALVLALTVGLLPVTSFADEAGAVPNTTVTEEANDVSPQEEADPEKSSEENSSEENSSEQEEKKEENSETESKQEETNDADSVKESDQTSSEQGQKGNPEETASTEDSNDKETSDMDAGDSSETNVSEPKESETVQTVPRTEANNKLDLSDLNSGIAAAEALVEKEYTVKSWAALQEALSAAKDLAAMAENDPEKVTQEEIDSAAKALKDAVDALVKAGDIFVNMNVPFADFYGDNSIDAVSTATSKGKLNSFLKAGTVYGSYTEGDGTIRGVVVPVKMTADQFDELTGKVSGDDKDFFISAPLTEEPAVYLELKDTSPSFSSIKGKETKEGTLTVEKVEYATKRRDIQIKLTEKIMPASDVYGAYMTMTDGSVYPLLQIASIYKADSMYEYGWSLGEMTEEVKDGTKVMDLTQMYITTLGKTIDTVTYITKDGLETYGLTYNNEKITIGEPSYVLMNIPYDEFYANEDGAVDGISSATLKGKARNVNVNGASYHQSEEAVTSEGIKGAMYPVKVSSLADLEALGGKQVTDDDEVSYILSARGTQTEVSLKGRDALQEAPSYSYYVLSEAPSHYKTLTVADGKASFSAASGKAAAGSEITGDVTMRARHADVEIKLSGLDVTPSDVSAVVMTADDGKYALHHVVNIWRGTEIGWNTSDINLPVGTKITNVRYYLKDGTITDYPANIELMVEITAEAEDGNTVKINGLPSNIADAKATVTSVDGENTVTFAEAAGISDGKTALTKELEDGREYTVAVSSSNYPDLTAVFTYKVDKTALQEQIKTPEALTQSDYTEESWKAVEDALKEARAADEKEHATQSEIDKAEKALKDAIDALVKKTDESGESKTSDSNTEDSSNSKTDQSSAGKSGVTEEDGKTAETAAVDYKIIEGANSTWTKGSSKGLLIVSNAPFDKFDSVIVDNKEIASASYKAEEGSTEITLLPEYLEKLTIGKHSFTIQSTDGSASTNFTIAKKAGSGSSNSSSKSSGSKGSSAKGSGSRSSAKTSDDNMGRILLYAALVIVSISVIAWLYSKRKKKV